MGSVEGTWQKRDHLPGNQSTPGWYVGINLLPIQHPHLSRLWSTPPLHDPVGRFTSMEPSASLKSECCVPVLPLGAEDGDLTLGFRRSHQVLVASLREFIGN